MRIVVGLTLLTMACTPGEPPGARRADAGSVNVSVPVPLPVLPPRGAEDAASRDSGTETETLTSTGTGVGDGGLAADDGALAQTEQKPDLADPLTLARAKALFAAMVADDPKPADVFFFPLDAYKQVKDSSNPEADWRGRLLANMARDIHEIHRARPNLQNARFVGLEIPQAASRWVKPGEEYNKIGYYRVFNSQLTYETADGARQSIPLKSLISWRGRYYLVHLSSIK